MRIVRLNFTKPEHTRIVLSMVVQSRLNYGDLDSDARLLAWHMHQGTWAVAMDSSGTIVGIACVVTLSDTGKDALLWLEVLQAYQQRGVGKTLLKWAQKQTHQKLVIKSVPSAVGFYHAAM